MEEAEKGKGAIVELGAIKTGLGKIAFNKVPLCGCETPFWMESTTNHRTFNQEDSLRGLNHKP